MHKSVKYIESIIGVILLTITLNLIFSPMNIVTGGTSGLAILFKNIFNIDISLFIIIFYILMLLLNLIVYGINNTKDILLFSILYPLFTKLFENISNIIFIDYDSNKLSLYIFAAVLCGIGNGLIFKNGFIVGGTDVIKKIISDKLHIPMGTSIFLFDAIIVLIGGYILGIMNVIYAIIIIYISSKITDRIIIGISRDKSFYIITEKEEEIRKYIKNDLNIGITEIDAYGFSNDKKHLLMSVINTKNYIKLKEEILKIDEDAFVIILDSYHTYHGGE